MNVQNENLLFTSACSLFHRTLSEFGETSSFQREPVSAYAGKNFEEEMEIRMGFGAFKWWNKRIFRPVAWFSGCGGLDGSAGVSPEPYVDEEIDIRIWMRDGCYFSLLDFGVFLSESEAGIRKAVKRYQRNNPDAEFAVGRYLFAVEFQGTDIRYDCNCILKKFPEVECVAMGRYPQRMFSGDGWIKKKLPANMYLFRMLTDFL